MPRIVRIEGIFESHLIVEDDDASDEQIIEMFEERIFYWCLEDPAERNSYETADAQIVIKEKRKEELPW